MEKKYVFQNYGSNIGLRSLGKSIRECIEKDLLKSDINLIFDFINVNTITTSFADECFGRLLNKHKFSYIVKRTSFVNTNGFISKVLKHVISRYLDNQ